MRPASCGEQRGQLKKNPYARTLDQAAYKLLTSNKDKGKASGSVEEETSQDASAEDEDEYDDIVDEEEEDAEAAGYLGAGKN